MNCAKALYPYIRISALLYIIILQWNILELSGLFRVVSCRSRRRLTNFDIYFIALLNVYKQGTPIITYPSLVQERTLNTHFGLKYYLSVMEQRPIHQSEILF